MAFGVYYRRYNNGIFVFFKSSDHLKQFQSYLNYCHINVSYTIETEQNNKLSYLDANVSHEQGKFVKNDCRKPIISSVYTHFDIFLPSTYQIGIFTY